MSDISDINIPKEEAPDTVVHIPESERTLEEEEKVTFYMATYKDVMEKIGMKPFEKNTVKFKRVVMPEFKDKRTQRIWEEEQIKRCEKGYKGMSGRMYFYFNYSWMVNLTKGKFTPDYQVCQNEWFKLITAVEEEGGWGVACVKRRRIGASWLEAADAIYEGIFKPFSITGMVSKSKEDSRLLFVKVNFIFDNLPDFLKVKVGGKTKDQIDFYKKTKDTLGNDKIEGNQSYIVVKAPTVSAFEGHMLNKIIIDEAGKQEELEQMFSFTEDVMMEDTVRVGIPVIFGTSGEIGKAGKGLKTMWDNAEIYRLHRFFFAGYMGIGVDEFGNDNIEENIRWIVYERKRRAKLSSKAYSDFLQRYPLTISEAFNQSSDGGLGNILKIKAQQDALEADPPKATKGWCAIGKDKNVVFKPEILGEIVIYEHAKAGLKDAYVAGLDPASHDKDDRSNLSDLSMYIIKKSHGVEPPKIVAQYTARPAQLNDYYQQSIMLLQYYNDCKVLIENNSPRIISYFDDNGFKNLMHYTPQGVVKLTGGRSNSIGITMNSTRKNYLADLCEEYIDESCEWIPDIELLKEFPKWMAENTDRIIGFGLALMLLKEDKTVARKKGATDTRLPRYGMSMGKNGRLIRTRK